MKLIEFQELINEIDLFEFKDEFNKVHTRHVEHNLYYELEHKNLFLDLCFTVFGTHDKYGFTVTEVVIIEDYTRVWENDTIEHELSIPKLASLQKILKERLNEII